VRKLRGAGAGSRQLIGIAVLLALFAVCANGSLALARAGSTGGTIGKTGKSIAGGDEARRQQPVRSAVRHRETARASSCSRSIGVWRGALGGDITYRSGGTVLGTIPANEGTWSCGSNGVSVTWTKIPFCWSLYVVVKWNVAELHK